MATIGAAEARCINCKTEVRERDDNCRKCGDRVKPRARLEREPAETLTEHTPDSMRRTAGIRRVLEAPPEDDGPGDVTPSNPVAPAPAVQLTEEQAAAIEKVREWFTAWHPYAHNTPFRLFGPAGTGKTTLARHIGPAVGAKRVVFGTFTGKAARVLRTKGVPATTIHSAIYALDFRTEKRARLAAAERELMQMQGETLDPITSGWADSLELAGAISQVSEEIETLRAELRRPAFTLNKMSEWAYADLIVLDEVSMVNEKIARDIESFGVPVLVLGDPAQLPPIEGGGHYTSAAPDVLLETVHRQALESPVLALATHVRLGGSWQDRLVKVSLDDAMAADQILVWKNATRWSLIRKIREKKGLPVGSPMPGDRVMCLVNNKDLGIFNGQQFEVMDIGHISEGMLLRDEDGRENWYMATADGFRGLEAEQAAKRQGYWAGDVGLFTWADAITVHKAQGSEWPTVYVVDQTHQMTRSTTAEKRAWMYTAISRASERVTLASTEVSA